MEFYLLPEIVVVAIITLLFYFLYGNIRIQENQIIASPSSSQLSLSRNCKHDVFPSFHGADVRISFLSHILKEFRRKGIDSFIDDDIQRGKSIGPALVEAIEGSNIAIVLLSKNYASSTWCLDELVEIMRCREEINKIVLTIFYEVDPTDVKKQTGEFGKVFKKTCKGKTKERVEKWTEVLSEVAKIAGYHSNRESEAIMIEKIAIDISDKLNNSIPSRDFDNLVGVEAHMENIGRFLRLDSDEVRMIGIWGPPGIGKTTIARFLLNQHSSNFQLSVFMENVRAMYTLPSCSEDYRARLHLQEQFLSQILNHRDIKIGHLGVAKERLKNKKILAILDNVDRAVQLQAIANEAHWFGHGSRIVVTTQDLRVLKAHGISHIYKVDFPSSDEALEIFCINAFGQKSPRDGFTELAQEVKCLAGRLPLGLKILGSYFRGMSKEEWIKVLATLWSRLDGEIESILKFSYDAFCDEDKYLFLHIACFFNYENIEIVEACLAKTFLDVKQGLHVLIEKSLISINDGVVVMHGLLVRLGHGIIRKQSVYKPGRRQFLVDTRDICEVLTDSTVGSGEVIGIHFDYNGKEFNISERSIRRIYNLQFLRFTGDYRNPNITSSLGHLNYISPQLRVLEWDGCQMTSLSFIFNTEFLVKLSLIDSKLEKLWEGSKPLPNLKWLYLSNSKNLKEFPDFSTATGLEVLDVSECSSLVKLPSSIGNAINTLILNFFGCSSLVELPSSIGNAINLEEINLDECSSLVEIPISIGNAINLQAIDFSGCSSLVELPISIGNAINLKVLDFSGCLSLVELPSSIENLRNLLELKLEGCSELEVLPINVKMESLETLDLDGCSKLKRFPEVSTNIKCLYLVGTSIEEVSSSISSLSRLEELHMSYSENLKECSWGHQFITKLHLSNSRIKNLGTWVKNCSRLKYLMLIGCKELVSLPELPASMLKLDVENCESLERLDCSFYNQDIILNFANCLKLGKEARDLIIHTSTSNVTVLSGKEIPTCFTYRADGCSLIVKLSERFFPSAVLFKACVVLEHRSFYEDWMDADCTIKVKLNNIDLPSLHDIGQPLMEHLYVFEFETYVTCNEISFELRVDHGRRDIKKCGIMEIVEPYNRYVNNGKEEKLLATIFLDDFIVDCFRGSSWERYGEEEDEEEEEVFHMSVLEKLRIAVDIYGFVLFASLLVSILAGTS